MTVRRSAMANTVVLHRFHQARPMKPRRRLVRHQAEPQTRLYGSLVDWPVRIGERPQWWLRFRYWDHAIAALLLVVVLLIAIYATGHRLQ